MLMCGVHHKLVDADENLSHYSVERLREIKTKHEALSQSTRSDTSLSAEALTALLETVRATAVPTTHMDFRGALINAGGHGGGPAGGGGGGGIIHVVGVTPASFREKVEVDGKPGKFPGGGGGGGGSIVFSGRLVSKDDIEHGLRVSCFLFANAAEVRNGLLYLLGAGWETFPVGVLPQDACVGVAGVIDTGTVVPSTLLALAIVVEDPSGRVAASDPFDLEVADAMRPIMRQCFRKAVRFRVTQPGVWRFTLRSGDIDLAESSLDIKVKG